jgi:tetratricopeptide (TPR) repeat protein
MHELLRQYAAERLEQQPEDEKKIRDQHCKFFADKLTRWKGELKGSQQAHITMEITSELENIRAAIDRMLDNAKPTYLENTIDALGIYFSMLNRFQEGATLCHLIAEKTKTFTSEDGLRFRVRVLGWQAYLLERAGNIKLARRILNKSMSIIGLSAILNDKFISPKVPDSESDQRIQAFVLWAAGNCYWDKDVAKTRWFFEQSLALYRRLGDRWSTALLLGCLAMAMVGAAKNGLCEVEQLYRESLDIAQSLGDHKRVIADYSSLGYVLIHTGRLEEGERYYDLASTTAEKTGVAMSVFYSIWKNEVNLRLGKFTQALSDLKAEITRYENQMVGKRVIEGKLFLSDCYRNIGDYEKAYSMVKDCLEYCIEEDYKRRGAECYIHLGMNSIVQDQYAEAQTWLERSDSLFQEFGVSENCEILTYLGYAAQGLGHIQEARIRFKRVLQLAINQHLWDSMYQLLPGLALFFADKGKFEYSIELYTLAQKNPYVANSQWFEDVAGKHIAKAAESLPPEVVEAAKERGRARDLWETAEELLLELSDDTIRS